MPRRFLFLIFMMLLSLGQAYAAKTVHRLVVNGVQLKVDIHEYVNSRGMRELRIDSHDLAHVTLGYARDLSGNGLVDTFFLQGNGGIHSYQREIPGESSKLRALKVLARHGQYSGKEYYIKLGTSFLGSLFMSMDHANQAQKTYYQDWMDLEELRIAFDKKNFLLNRDERIYVLNLMMSGHQTAYLKLKNSINKANNIWIADAALWLGGGILLKGALKAVTLKKAAVKATAGVGARIALASYQATVRQAIRGLSARTVLNGSKNLIIKGLAGVKKEWKYIALSTGIQLGVEASVNYDEIKDPRPGILAQNLMAHKSIRENVAISVTDTLLMAGAANIAKTNKARFALLGMIGATSSATVGSAINGQQNKARVIFDTAWSVGIDTTQMMTELKVLHYFQEKAVRARNPRLKVVGYAIVFVTQIAGYYGYAHAAKYVESKSQLQDGQLILVPVIVTK